MPTATHSRAEIHLTTDRDISAFLQAAMNQDDELVLENFDGSRRVSASSMLGVMYAAAEFGQVYLVNVTNDANIGAEFNKFRP
jgi:phosphotransferase system HPr-like phosphotransfer protein